MGNHSRDAAISSISIKVAHFKMDKLAPSSLTKAVLRQGDLLAISSSLEWKRIVHAMRYPGLSEYVFVPHKYIHSTPILSPTPGGMDFEKSETLTKPPHLNKLKTQQVSTSSND
ncbi:hypothetical protein H257_03130 [Aphanomyces astaci]|uniref:Uncharacterized protein n=1 Tax=Aphanomyces astaci TaxID=112090 RepID=W4H0C9_APHAT|nr:hypothetical protein H257_03130 [Aphanomyces astaci]ETV85372.1 hypothetical protein H257_03130 [Aphanomyces astaci]|eukprot:XP_009825390.1 hypothetical protein H257_03130 [Aphanomyces astaci]